MAYRIQPFILGTRRKRLHGDNSGLTIDFYRALKAILEDAIALEAPSMENYVPSQPFSELIVTMDHLVSWGSCGSGQAGSQGLVREISDKIAKFLSAAQKTVQSTAPDDEYISDDDCFCWLIRLVTLRKQPRTPEDYLEELKELQINELLRDNSFTLGKSGLPNHLSICFGEVLYLHKNGTRTVRIDNHLEKQAPSVNAVPSIFHVVATNNEHLKECHALHEWARNSWDARFEEWAPDVVEATETATRRLNALPKVHRDEVAIERFHAIERHKIDASRNNRDQSARVFNHMKELKATFSLNGGLQIDARCAKCRMLFAYCVGPESYKEASDMEKLMKPFYPNTCSEGLLHLLCRQAHLRGCVQHGSGE